jgi:hypothetical protein
VAVQPKKAKGARRQAEAHAKPGPPARLPVELELRSSPIETIPGDYVLKLTADVVSIFAFSAFR